MIYETLKPYLYITIAGLFLLFEMSLQVSVSVITPELMSDFHISAAGIGFISSFFFYSYTIMQLPSGILFDCISSKKIIGTSFMLCTLGTFLFAFSNGIFLASVGRFLIGFGSAFAFVSVLYTASQWFSHRYFAIITGLGMVMASLGAMGGQMPLAYLVGLVGWRESLFILAVVGVILSVLSFILIEDKAGKKSFTWRKFYVIIQELLLILKKERTWFIALFAFAIWSPITGFASLWGVPFIERAYSMSVEKAAFSCSLIWVGVAFGSLFFGWWSEKAKKRNLPLRFGAILGVVSSILVIYFSVNQYLLDILLICFGIATGGQSLIFAVMKDVTDKHLIGTGIGLINMAVVASGFVFQPIIGILLKILRPVHENAESVSYTLGDYHIALAVIPSIFIISFLVSLFFIKETYRAQPVEGNE